MMDSLFGKSHLFRPAGSGNPPPLFRYSIAAVTVWAAVGLRSALDPVLGRNAPYLPFALAIMLAGRFGGRGPALMATAISTVSTWWLFLEPRYSFATSDRAADAGLTLFVIVGTLISLSLGRLRETLIASARAEAALRRQAQLIDLSQDAIITADANRVITGWNAGATEMYGWTEKEATGYGIRDLLQSENPAKAAEIDSILYRDGRWDGELTQTACTGRQIIVESRQVLLRDETGAPIGILEINRDITGRKRAQEELAEAHRETTEILESVSDGFNAFDREWRYTYVNAAGARMVGKEREDLIGKNLWEIWPKAEDSPFGRAYRRAARENVPVHVDAFYPEPLNCWFQVRCYPSPTGVSVFFTDVTERRQAEERLRQKQKLESIGQLAGGVAHDFNNLLTVIMGSACVALDKCPECEQFQAIRSASERAADLTRQLLAYAGKSRAIPKLLDLTELVSRSTALLHASVPRKIGLSLNLASGLPLLEADPSQVEQILMNLVINSGEAIPAKAGGKIEITTSSLEVTPEVARHQPPPYEIDAGLYVCLEVRDNGTGMDEATRAHIFDPFFSTKFTGRGLGLAAVQGIVRTARGLIEVISSPGKGSTFRVYLRASSERRTPQIARTRPQPLVRVSSKVMVVEDEEMVRKLAALHLRQQGYEVQEAQDGHHALQLLDGSPSLPALVLLDLAMPVMGGDELVPVLESRYPHMKIVLSSGYPEDEARKISPNGSVRGFLQKPYSGRALTEKIAQVLGVN